MSDVTCPSCSHRFEVSSSDNWDENGFDEVCPECGVYLVIDVETEYEYEAAMDDQEQRARDN